MFRLLLKYLAPTQVEQVPIYINKNQSGYGILVNGVVLTAYHVVENSGTITVKNIIYDIYIFIDEYDIAVLKKPDKNVDCDDFLERLKTYTNYSKINTCMSHIGKPFNIQNTEIILDDIECGYIRTNIFPPVPTLGFSFDTDENLEGYSGSIITRHNVPYGILISQNINTKKITGMSLEIIYRILYYYIKNNMKFYCFPVDLKDNIINNNFRNLMKNDIIYKINEIELRENTIYDDNLKSDIPYDTYILINGLKNIQVEYYRRNKNNSKSHVTNICLREFEYKYVSLSYRNTGKKYQLNSLVFSELSEETIVKMFNDKIKILDNLYEKLYSRKKMIYLANIENEDVQSKFKEKNVDLRSELYILNKISGKKINNLDDLEKYKSSKTIKVELYDSSMNNIKIKI